MEKKVKKKLRQILIFFVVLYANTATARFLGDLNPTGNDGWVQKSINEGKRVEKRVEKQINRTDEDLHDIAKRVGKASEEAVRDTRDEIARYFRRGREELEQAEKNGDLKLFSDGTIEVHLWNLQENEREIYGRPIDMNSIALKNLYIFDKNDFLSYEITKTGTVLSAFSGLPVDKFVLRFKLKEEEKKP